jgi:predicted nucleic acid-binding protein
MASPPGYLIDTNILLRLSRLDDPRHQLIKMAPEELNGRGAGLYFSLQNIAEFWNVCTRPADRNGYGLSIVETDQCVEELEFTMTFLPDNERVYSIWRRLVVANNVRGVQVHDARLAAIMQAYGLKQILTLNQPDFLRYSNLQAIHPSQVQPSARQP